ncbi:MAG TPA: hypothetical protein VGS80_11745, partial [Ktedonobacterales bacterium]|nr:hypothetical protein [Ktedonobacterales bacterium]
MGWAALWEEPRGRDIYQQGRIAYQTDGNETLLATFTYDPNGVPESVVVGTDPTSTSARYYYVYDGHGDVVALSDANGNVVASYGYDAFGALTSISESFTNGWTNPYRCDGETGLYWMSVRAARVESGAGILYPGGCDSGAITDRVLARQSLCRRCSSRSPKRGSQQMAGLRANEHRDGEKRAAHCGVADFMVVGDYGVERACTIRILLFDAFQRWAASARAICADERCCRGIAPPAADTGAAAPEYPPPGGRMVRASGCLGDARGGGDHLWRERGRRMEHGPDRRRAVVHDAGVRAAALPY